MSHHRQRTNSGDGHPMTHRTRAQERIDEIDVSPTKLLADMDKLKSELDEAHKQSDEYLGLLQRERAEFNNYRRRTAEEGERTVPSVVAFTKTGERLVGQLAKRQAVTNPTNTVYSIKRFMGRRWDDPEVKRSKDLVPYTVEKDPKSDGVVVKVGDGKTYTPPEISAMVLQKLRTDAEAYLGEKVTEAVI